MTKAPINARNAIIFEIGAYYEVDDLPADGPMWGEQPLAVIAAAHAKIIKLRAGSNYSAEAAALLREASQDRYGALVREIVSATRYGWVDDDEDWKMLQQLMMAIAEALKAN